MTTVSPDFEAQTQVSRHTSEAVAEPPAAAPSGDPAQIGLPSFIVGSVALGLVLVGYVPAAAVGASLPIILAATGFGLAIAAVWAAAVSQSAVASVFGIFTGFWWSYAVLVLGLTHHWFGISTAAATSTQGLFLISWLVVIGMLTLATLRLPSAYTLLFLLIDVALVLVLISTLQGSATLAKVAGYVVLAFAAVGVYLYFSSTSQATGGPALPLGPPIMR
jgi:succinate-acetate transporter protein